MQQFITTTKRAKILSLVAVHKSHKQLSSCRGTASCAMSF